MVRSLVGALLAVGEHRREPGWCATLLTSAPAPATSPPRRRGLTLVGVDYPPDDQLEARTKVTRDSVDVSAYRYAASRDDVQTRPATKSAA